MKQRDDWHLTEALHYDQGRGDPYAAAVRATRMPMVITDPAQDDNPIVYCNVAFQKLTGYEREEIIGRNCRFLQGADTDREKVQKVRAAIEAGEDIEVDLLNYRRDGSTFWNALYLSPVRDEGGTIRFFFASQLDVTERVEAQHLINEQKSIVERKVESRTADLEEALEAKTVLLHEVDHRVKNNLTMIGSLLRLEARAIEDPEISKKLTAMLERVDALAVVHRQLYESSDITMFDLGEFAGSLASDIVGSSGRTNIDLKIEAETVCVSANNASALGLIFNEIITNAIKHAYADGRGGTLSIFSGERDGEGVVRICDDGPGMTDVSRAGSIGTTLITRLSKQANARAVWSDNEPGTCVTVTFPSFKR